MPRIDPAMTDRNGLLGRFDEFLPVRLTMDEIVKLAIEAKAGSRPGPDERSAAPVLDLDAGVLVRYRLASADIRNDLADMGADSPFATGADAPKQTAVFGLVDRDTGRAKAIACLYVERDEGARIADLSVSKALPPSGDDVLEMLAALDVPATWRTGLDAKLADAYDLWHDAAAGWERRPAVTLVVVRMKRSCFSTRPVLEESLDIFLPPHPERPLAHADEDLAYRAKCFYLGCAFERLEDLGMAEGTRAGFSSWMPSDPQVVKVVGNALDTELAALEGYWDRKPADEDDEDASPSPGI